MKIIVLRRFYLQFDHYNPDQRMSQKDVVISMIEAISFNFACIDQGEPEVQVQTIYQTIPFFHEILSLIKPEIVHNFDALHIVANNFLRSCNRCMNYISKESNNLEQFISFLDQLINSSLVAECNDSITQLMIGILNIHDISLDNLKLFEKPFKSYFSPCIFKAGEEFGLMCSEWLIHVNACE